MEDIEKYKIFYFNALKASNKYRQNHRDILREKAKDYYDLNIEYKEQKKMKMRENYYKKKILSENLKSENT